MNRFERLASTLLSGMRDTLGIVAVKAEFEAQGMELNQLIRLKDIASSAGLGIALKLGGAEDVWGLKQALLIGVSGIIFPMVESAYALQKSLEAAKTYISLDERKNIHLAVNIETELAFNNLGKILEVGTQGGLDAVTLGRVDMVGSLGLGRDAINSERVFGIAQSICTQVKDTGFEMTMGGGIEAESQTFIERLVDCAILDRFETRMIVFPAAVALEKGQYEVAVRSAHRFEKYWLESLVAKYGTLAEQDAKRLKMLNQRIGDE